MSIPFHHNTESGQTMAEYSVVLGALILAVIAVIGLLGTAISNRLGPVATMFAGLVT